MRSTARSSDLDAVAERVLQRAARPDVDHAGQRLVERLEQRARAEAGAELGPVQSLAPAGEQHQAHEVGDVARRVGVGQAARRRQSVGVARRVHCACTRV